MRYFAYGSNLDWSQIRRRCPSVRFVGTAVLHGHRLAFTRYSPRRACGVADAVPDARSVIWGVVYDIDERDVASLDRAEGFEPGRTENAYQREEREVLLEGDPRRVLMVQTYLVQQKAGPFAPSSEYAHLIVNGARSWGLPTGYILGLAGIETE